MFQILLNNGPIYAAYTIPWTTTGHIVLVTGVDIGKDIVYTNNPWGVKGQQSFQEFCEGFASGSYYEDPRFSLYGIYVPTF